MSLSAPICVEGYFTVTLSSAPPPLCTPIRCLSQCSASIALQQAIPTKPSILPRRHRSCLNEPVITSAEPATAPTTPSWSPPPCTCCATCSPCTSPAVEPQTTSTVGLDASVSILDNPDKDVTWQVYHLTREALRIIWHQRPGHMHSRRVRDMHKYAFGVPNLSIATEIDDWPICLKTKLHKVNKSTSSTRKATQCNQRISIDFGFVVQSSKQGQRSRWKFDPCHALKCPLGISFFGRMRLIISSDSTT
jgi:hypothetical protein